MREHDFLIVAGLAVLLSTTAMAGVSDANRLSGGGLVTQSGVLSYDISQLPTEGPVKVTGMVSEIANTKEFTLKDNTGSVSIDIVSSEPTVVKKGTHVTVIGTIDKHAIGKSIAAEEVVVVAEATKK